MRVDSPDYPKPFSKEDLLERLEHLPDGHPSSPRFSDGTRRPPVTRLEDLELPESDFEAEPIADAKPEPDQQATPPADQARPYTDGEWADHLIDFRGSAEQARIAGLATDQRYTIDPDKEQWTTDRARAHRELVMDLYQAANHVPNDHLAIVAGGLPGSGKSTVLASHLGADQKRYMTINPDGIKEELVRRGLLPSIDGMSPMETADLAHEESSHIAKQLARKALAEGRNIIWDITMSSRDSTKQRIDDLRAAGYTRIEGIFVDIPIEASIRRADARHRSGEDQYRAGHGLGGRYVSPELIRAHADAEFASVNRRTFGHVKHRLDRWSRYDNSVDGRAAQVVDSGKRGAESRNQET